MGFLTSFPSDAGSRTGVLRATTPKAKNAVSLNPVVPYGGIPTAATATPAVDYAKLLGNDYGLIQSNANIGAQGLTDMAALNAARQRAIAQFGSVPGQTTGTGDLSGAIDETTRQLAEQATSSGVSTTAQLRKAYDTQRQSVNSNLAARGVLRSGAYGQHANEDLSNFNLASYQASQGLMDYLSGLYSGYQAQQQSLRDKQLQAENDALNRVIAQINAGQLTSGQAPAEPTPTFTSGPAETGVPAVEGPVVGFPDVGSIARPSVPDEPPPWLTYQPSDADRGTPSYTPPPLPNVLQYLPSDAGDRRYVPPAPKPRRAAPYAGQVARNSY